jgi:hypothetical protein
VEAYLGLRPEGNFSIMIRATSFPPLAASVVAGDAINNLRSALDLTISAACRANGTTNLGNTYFAIAKEGERGWDDLVTGKRKRMKAATPAIVQLTRSFKPWAGGNDILYAISHLAGIDKHQALLGMSVHRGGMALSGMTLSHVENKPIQMRAKQYARLSREEPEASLIDFDHGVKVSVDGPIKINIRLGFTANQIQPHIGAVSFLSDALSETAKIVETFATASTEGALR